MADERRKQDEASKRRVLGNDNEKVTSKSQTSSHANAEKVVESITLEEELVAGSVHPVGKRSIEFTKHTMHEGDLKRMRDSHELNKAHEQGLLGAFTCSFLDNPGLPDLWFGPQDGDIRFRGKSRTPSRPGKPRLSRRRYMRGSPKPVTSLESCLRAQLHFDEDKRVSRSLFYEESQAPGLGEVQALESGSSPLSSVGFPAKQPLHLPPLVRRQTRQRLSRPSVSRSHEALLFSFGVGVGLLHMTKLNNAELEKLTSRLKETEQLLQDLQANAAAASSKNIEPVVQQGNMEELEAQLEAELELMQLQTAEVDFEGIGEVVRDQLNPTGLPGASDLEEDRNESGHREGNGKNWAVSPRELDKRLRLLLETRQEERIAQLEEELENAENQLQDREQELTLWKERVHLLTQITLSPSGERDTDIRHNEEVPEIDRKLSSPAYAFGEDHWREQSPNDDICDEFLKSVDVRPIDSSDAGPAEVSSYSASELDESWQELTGRHARPTPKHYGYSERNIEEHRLHQPIQQDRKESSSWSFNFIRHAGASTPLEDIRSNKLVNTPRSKQEASASILDKIRYWENLSKGSTKSEAANSPEPGHYTPQTDQVSPLGRFSCSDISVSGDEEHHLGDVLIKRIVEKSRKGSPLLKDVQLMLAWQT